jgi:hypothetical protein
MNRRILVLGAGLLGTLAWSAWLFMNGKPDSAADVVQVAARPTTSSARAAASPSAPLSAPQSASLSASAPIALAATANPSMSSNADALARQPNPPARVRNLFSDYSFEAPRPKAPPPPPPRAPPLPFAYAGRLVIDGQTTYLLEHGDAPLVKIVVGASDGAFQLVEADAQQLIFLHGPTGDRVPLHFASAKAH